MDEFTAILTGVDLDAIQTPEADGLPAVIVTDYRQIKLAVVDIEVSDATVFEATEYTKRLNVFRKALDTEKKKVLDPLKAAVAAAEAPFKRLAGELEKLDSMLRGKLLTYNQAKRAAEQARLEAEREAQRKALEEATNQAILEGKLEDARKIAEAEKYTSEQVVIAPKVSVHAPQATASTVTRWKYEVTNPAVVPREFCEPSPALINRAVQNGVRVIPGVRIWPEESISIR